MALLENNNSSTEKKENNTTRQTSNSINIPTSNNNNNSSNNNISLSPAVNAFQQFWPSSNTTTTTKSGSISSSPQKTSFLNKKASINNMNNNYISTTTTATSSILSTSPLLSTSPSVGSPLKYNDYKGNNNNNNNNNIPNRIPDNLPIHIKDGYVYKDKVVILDQEKKEQLLKVGIIKLQSEWTYWYDRYVPNLPASEYEANLQVISTVGTVQKFWSVYNNIDGPEKLSFRSNLHFMRKGIKPIWEDPKNEYGGSYNFKISKQNSSIVWRDLLVLLIGEKIEQWLDDSICGLSVSSRQHCDNYQIWISTGQDKNEPDGKIKKALSDLLSPMEIQSFYFKGK